MVAADRPEFLGVMKRLGATFGRQVDDLTIAAFWDALSDLPLDVLNEAAFAHCRRGDRFPVPATLRQAAAEVCRVRADAEREAERQARLAAYREVRAFPAPSHATVEAPAADPNQAARVLAQIAVWRKANP